MDQCIIGGHRCNASSHIYAEFGIPQFAVHLDDGRVDGGYD